MQTPFQFKNFYTLQTKTDQPLVDSEFLCWLIGFFEGDGHFGLDGRVSISQSSRDVQVLYKIKTTLGFGIVRKDGVNCYKWITNMDQECAARLALLLNGNLVRQTRVNLFQNWVNYWVFKKDNEEFMSLVGPGFVLDVQQKAKPELVCFTNGWLTGFTDADGCWTITVYKTGSKKNPQATVSSVVASQKDPEWVDNMISLLKMGRKRSKTTNINQAWVVDKRDDIEVLIDYIERFPYKTKKSVSFNLFCKVRRRILKREHYTSYSQIKRVASLINP